MKKLVFALALCLCFVGCSEQLTLEREIRVLQKRIQTAKEVEILKSRRNLLKAELDTFETRPEGNVAPVTSQ